MVIKEIYLKKFRNHREFHCYLEDRLNIVYGPNGSGKTNIAEGLYYLLTGESFQGIPTKEMVLSGSDEMIVSGKVSIKGLTKDIRYYWKSGQQLTVKENLKKSKPSNIIKSSSVVEFSPDDLYLIKGEPQNRRLFLDKILFLLDNKYREKQLDYNRILKHRNKALKEKRAGWEKQTESWAEGLVINGSYIVLKREDFRKKLQYILEVKTREAELKELHIEYLSSVNPAETIEKTSENFWNILEEKKKDEPTRGRTLAGPHLDDLDIFIGGLRAKTCSSQGEKRLVSMLLKEACADLLEKEKTEAPVVIMDDLLSELDKKNKLKAQSLINSNRQTIITTTTLDFFAPRIIEKAKIIKLGET